MDTSIAFISDTQLLTECNKIPNIKNRAYLVDDLIRTYNLYDHMNVFKVEPVSYDDLIQFHSSSYINYFKQLNDHEYSLIETENEYGIGYDCPVLENIWKFVTFIAGASVTAAKLLTTMKYNYAINWCGGWHHAQRDSAEGFCYVNDIVLAIETLRNYFGRVLYIDLDVHHGNGVEYAYMTTDRVLTLSFHQFEPGFYPTSGSLNDIGIDKGKFYSVNVPLKEGITNESYISLFKKISSMVYCSYKPNCIVVQCGADSLIGDPIGGFNLTPKAYVDCIKTVISWQKPVLFLGGGGYNLPNVARCWTCLTAVIAKQENKLPADIPDCKYFSSYGPDFTLNISPGNRKDYNDTGYLNKIIKTIENNMKMIQN
ncbi:histone deacetylase 8-like [Daktulosphaira vitifoliae]|uniref:histone deacetylase 8-like n=1 Tax=Daktulosphaira vitifoliae TaxID=58002 RepID=UPI0021AA956A|nr:histone deacetylase 8-like [Daktulosphaira vitifoliae]XP_050529322.1 histone deacetylase 8-like [Daktulosphaira vitifoliae]